MAEQQTTKGPVGYVKGKQEVLLGHGNVHNDPCFSEKNVATACCKIKSRQNCNFELHNYTRCKRFWEGVKRERKQAGIKPHLPPLEEREQAFEDYKHVLHDLQNPKKKCVIM